jgi:hypothetical protein
MVREFISASDNKDALRCHGEYLFLPKSLKVLFSLGSFAFPFAAVHLKLRHGSSEFVRRGIDSIAVLLTT